MTFDTESRISRTVAATGTATHTRYSTTRVSATALVRTVVWWIRAWRFVSAASASTVRWIGNTVTPVGWLVIAVLVLLPVGIALGWVELVAAGLVAAVVLVIAVPFLFGAHSYEVSLQLADERVVTGSEVLGTITVTNTSRRLALPGRIDVPTGDGLTDVHVPLLRAGHVHVERITVAAAHRGIITVGPMTSVRTDPLGTLKRELAWVDVHEIFVHPYTVPIPSTSAGFIKDLDGNPSSQIVDSDISFHAIREYARGDAQRNIHWKSTAKTGKIMVRQFEETKRSRLAILLSLDTAEYANDDEFELAVSVAGSLGVRAIRDGRDLALVASDEIPEFIKKSVRSIKSLSVLSTRTLLDDLSSVDASTAIMPIEEVCTLAAQVIDDLSIAFVLCGSQITPRRLQSIAVKFPAGVSVVAVVANEAASPGIRVLSGITVMTVALIDDLKELMARAAR